MLPSDMSLIDDKEFRPWVEKYAKDRDLFYRDFSAAFAKLIELGIDRDSAGNVHKRGLETDSKRVTVSGEDRKVHVSKL